VTADTDSSSRQYWVKSSRTQSKEDLIRCYKSFVGDRKCELGNRKKLRGFDPRRGDHQTARAIRTC
jgi:hypothetical protein